MAVTAASLKANRAEFDSIADAVVTAYIAKASRRVDPDVWGDLEDDGVELLACDMLAQSPYCQPMRLVRDGKTIYGTDFYSMARQVGGAYRMLPE